MEPSADGVIGSLTSSYEADNSWLLEESISASLDTFSLIFGILRLCLSDSLSAESLGTNADVVCAYLFVFSSSYGLEKMRFGFKIAFSGVCFVFTYFDPDTDFF